MNEANPLTGLGGVTPSSELLKGDYSANPGNEGNWVELQMVRRVQRRPSLWKGQRKKVRRNEFPSRCSLWGGIVWRRWGRLGGGLLDDVR